MKLLTLFLLFSCQSPDDWKTYTIKKGNHSSGVHGKPCYTQSVSFKAIFDNSAVYKIGIEQHDLNKLYGFSEGLNHKSNSARFGWRWYNNRIEIFGYTRVDGEFYFKYITSVNRFKENNYRIMSYGDQYVFTVDSISIGMKRGKESGSGYCLYPWFGGTCTAPHDVTIKIKE